MKQLRVRIAALVITAAFFSCETKQSGKPNVEPAASPAELEASGQFSIETFGVDDGKWGYRILENGKMVINQPHIPAIQGARGFDSKEKAEKAAGFVLGKMKAGFMPPAVTEKELDSLGVL